VRAACFALQQVQSVNECKTTQFARGNALGIDRMKATPFNRKFGISHWENRLFIRFARLTAWFALASLFTLLSAAQQTTPPSSPESTGQAQPQAPAQGQPSPSAQPLPADKDKKGQDAGGQGKDSGTSNDRLFYTLPNFLSLENGGKVPPLTTKEKYAVVARGTFDPVQFPWWGLLAAINQADNAEPAFGQGFEGYAKRYGTTAADGIIENFMTAAVLPSLLHQDPRFFQSSKGGFARRGGYAISRIFVTRTDSGHSQFNYSEIFGSAAAAAISTYSYHPRSTYLSTPTNPHMFVGSDRTLENTADVWGTQVALDTFTIVVKEFWPDIHRKLSHKHKVDAGSAAP
jgi:hypothetical protein